MITFCERAEENGVGAWKKLRRRTAGLCQMASTRNQNKRVRIQTIELEKGGALLVRELSKPKTAGGPFDLFWVLYRTRPRGGALD